jgi:hypothetical protein
MLILLSGVINASSNTSSCTTRLGYFDANNGLFFQYTNNTISVVLRNITIDTQINQTSWNIDKMDGTGASSISLDFTKSQLYVIDFEWLSVGRIRFGFYLFGKINYCHQITNLNSLTAPYMLSPNLPIRYEIISTSGATGSLVQICSTVISEGGYTPIGRAFSIGTDPNTSGLPVSTTEVKQRLIKEDSVKPKPALTICCFLDESKTKESVEVSICANTVESSSKFGSSNSIFANKCK